MYLRRLFVALSMIAGLNYYYKGTDNLRTLQILRAMAATSVVYSHIGVNPDFGQFGVDIFFVISGFVMTLIVENGQKPATFLLKRVLRILPLYWILTTCLLILAIIKPELLNSTTANFTNYLKSIFFIPYFKENGSLSPLLALGWTLNYEVFFYACIWLSILLVRRVYIPSVFLLLVASFFYGVWSTYPVANTFFGNGLVFEFLFGILAFKIYKFLLNKKLDTKLLLFISLTCYLFMVLYEFKYMINNIGRVYFYGVPSFFLVVSVTALEKAIDYKEGTIVRALVCIGDASYATYLSHLYSRACKSLETRMNTGFS